MEKTTNNCDESIEDILSRNWEYITSNETIDLDHIGASAEMRTKIRELIKAENLNAVNQNTSKPIKKVNSFYSKYGKRALDIFISSIALIVTLPVNCFLLVCTFADVGLPVFFKQTRIGMNERDFQIIKFRNMTNATDQNGNLLPPKDRVTKFGKVVRRLSLDELLNFWSVLKGDMSIIGPRPLVADYQVCMSDRHRSRANVRPGLECPIIKNTEDKRTWSAQFENDVHYAENVSLKLDCQMLFALVRTVFDRKSSKMRGDAKRGSFMGYEKNGESINSMNIPSYFIMKLAEKTEESLKK